MTDLNTTEVDMDKIVSIVRDDYGIPAYVEQTGGGTATIYAGPTHHEDGWGTRHAAAAGPGWFAGPHWTKGRGIVSDFFVGPDDDGSGDFADLATDSPLTGSWEHRAAALIVAQVWTSVGK